MRAGSILPLALLAVAVRSAAAGPGPDPVDRVDPFLGTGGHGHTHPAATSPFGMVQLGPDTRLTGWDGCSGYHFTDHALYGFSHTHLSGTGISDYGDVLLLPLTAPGRTAGLLAAAPDSTWAVPFRKETERAGAGWWTGELPAGGIDVELTATPRTGWHRYTFPDRAEAGLLVDLAHRDRVLDSGIRIVNEHEIEGTRRSTGWARDQVVHFVARFSRPILSHRIFSCGDDGAGRKAVLTFGGDGRELLVKVGLSAVDREGARRNLGREAAGWDFDATRQAARAAWEAELGRIRVEGGTPEEQVLFATGLYHSLLAPNLWSDVDGRYRGMDGRIHAGGPDPRYTVFSLWDTFRATHPLLAWIDPERTRAFLTTFLGMYREGGRLPVWELAANETDTMIGYHSVSVIADAWVKGIRGFDAELALEAMIASAEGDRAGLPDYRRQGFLGAENESESVSRTLEYAYDDWCIAEMAESLGHPERAAEFRRRAQGWRHLLDPDTRFFRARNDQRFVEPFDPSRVDFHYTEANAWQYAFFVPHDVEGLIRAHGGDDAFRERLDAMFEADTTTTGRDQADITGLLGQYAHGNEPSHHMAWLYHYAGRPDRSAERVGEILRRFYRAAPDGLAGNEDCGQMSSWYVLAALGLYPVCPGSPDWVLGVPRFDRATIALPGGDAFAIEAEGPVDGAHVLRAELNGAPLTRSFLRHEEISRGGTLRIIRGHGPTDWGTAPGDRPVSRGGGDRVPAAPFVRGSAAPFREEATAELACADPDAAIRWAVLPASAPPERWTPYRAPLTFRETTRIAAFSELDGVRSPVVVATFRKILHDWRVTLAPDPAPQYRADGPPTLVDGRRGAIDWRTGAWLGWQGTDAEVTIDLGEVRTVRSAGAGFLQDIRSWIWMPRRVRVSVSEDGRTFREVARISAPLSDREEESSRRDLVAEIGAPARYVRLHAETYGTIPGWHLGAGGQAWIFADEIVVR